MATRIVPTQFPTVQAAISSASAGDTIQLAGRYGYELAFVSVNDLTFDGTDLAHDVFLSLAPGITAISLTGTADFEVSGGAGGDVIGGNAGDNRLAGAAGSDSISGGAGNDTIEGGAGADQINGGSESDTASYADSTAAVQLDLKNLGAQVSGGDAAGDILTAVENLIGSAFADRLTGDAVLAGQVVAVANILDGGAGSDTLLGGAGNDTYYVDSTGDSVIEQPGGGNDDRVLARASYALQGGSDVETLAAESFTGTAAVNLTGNELSNTLIGNAAANTLRGMAGNDALIGGAGADVLDGGAGSDVADYSQSPAGVTVALGGVGIGGHAQGDQLLGIEGVFGSSFNDALTGDTAKNSLFGGAGNDTLAGGAGPDILDGGSGTDTVTYASSGAAVTATLDGGSGSGGEAQGDSLHLVEVLIGSSFNDLLTGDDNPNTLDGGAGQDTIEGGRGADRLVGGGNNDTADYRHSAVGVQVDLTVSGPQSSGGDAAGDILSGISNLNGTGLSDTLSGDAGANRLAGDSGDDILAGRGGADTLVGGGGIDTATYVSSTAVQVNLLTGTAAGGEAQGDTLSGITNLIGGNQGDVLTGDAADNALEGRGGVDTLDGGAGDDTLLGGLGGDHTVGGDRLTGGIGLDTVSYAASTKAVDVDLTNAGFQVSTAGSDADGDVLAGIEAVIGSSFGDVLTGDLNANSLIGGDGADTLDGGAGQDALEGGEGADQASGGAGNDTIVGHTGDDTLSGGADGDSLLGGLGKDALNGDSGNDTLDGGVGADTMDGGDGFDTARYDTIGASINIDLEQGIFEVGGEVGDVLISIEKVDGGGSNDRMRGDANANIFDGGGGHDFLDGRGGADTLNAGSGNDWLAGGPGADLLNGADGSDTARYDFDTGIVTGVQVDLALIGPQVGTGHANGDVFSGIENAVGTIADDVLRGTAGDNIIAGNIGADLIDGRLGNDTADYSLSGLPVQVDLTIVGPQVGGAQGEATGDVLISIENLTGGGFADILIGDANDNILHGGPGADTLNGGAGFDMASYGGVVLATLGSLPFGGVTASLADPGLNTGAALGDFYISIEGLAGSDHEDSLFGNAAANRLVGNAGDDMLSGGAGADHLDGGDGTDTARYVNSTAVTINLGTGAAGGGEANGDQLIFIENLTGGSFGDSLTGDLQDNRLEGRAGADTLAGGLGDDTIEGGSGADSIDGGENTMAGDTASYAAAAGAVEVDLFNGEGTAGEALGDTLTNIENLAGSAFSDLLKGDGQNNLLTGGAGDDTLEGGKGADLIIGGPGTDTASYASSGPVEVDLSLSGPQLSPFHAEGDSLFLIENLEGGDAGDRLTGDSAANRLDGGVGEDTLEGGGGTDTLVGGSGFDTASFARSAQGVVASLLAGSGGGDALTEIEALAGSLFADTLTGDGGGNRLFGDLGNDTLNGGAGGDVLDGGQGNDAMTGGANDDLFLVDSAADVVNEAVGGGSDSVLAAISYTLAAGIEVEVLTAAAGSLSIHLTGNEFDNAVMGNAGFNMLAGGGGDDTIEGGAGADVIAGGLGRDTASYARSGAAVRVNLANAGQTGGDAAGDNLSGVENLLGSAFGDTLAGDGGANVLNGADGNDTLNGGTGNDTLDGGSNIDTAIYTHSVQGVIVNLSSASNHATGVEIGTDQLFSIENVVGGLGDDRMTGDAGANSIHGGEGRDTINGAGGADTMAGGAGDDSYVVDNAGDRVFETASAGIDAAQSSISHALSANVEKLTLTGTAAINATGNVLANTLVGNAAANVLNGGAGADTMAGAAGNDVYIVDNAGDRAFEAVNAGIDTVQSSIGHALGANLENLRLLGTAAVNGTGNTLANTLTGNTAVNGLNGAAGNDGLNGGLGNDVLAGGAGLDSFIFNTALSATANVDAITDFVAADDTIRLSKSVFTAFAAQGTNTFLGAGVLADWNAANEADDRILYRHLDGGDADTTKDQIWLYYDANGGADTDAVLFAKLTNQPGITLTANDFLIVA